MHLTNGDRLITANSGATRWGTGAYTYDAMGNMLTSNLGGNAQTFTSQGTTPKMAAVTYDAAGNETANGSQYTSRNELSTGGHSYDGRGVRVKREWTQAPDFTPMRTDWQYSPELHPLNVTTYAYDGWLSWAPTQSRQIVWFGDLPVAQYDIDSPLEVNNVPTLRYTFTDYLGTPILQTDETGAISWQAEYQPYGTIHTYRAGAPADQPLRLPGQDYTSQSRGEGDYYNIFRWYRAGWGRYTQADPIGLSAGIDLYRYAYDNPNSYTDPTGLFVDPTKALEHIAKQLLDSCTIVNGGPKPLPPIGIGFGIFLDARPASNPSENAAERLLRVPYPKCAKKCQENNCPPCNPPLGTIGYNYHKVPPHDPHPGIDGDHVHYFQMQQIPSNCDCFWKNLHIAGGPPPVPFALPMATSDPWP